MKQQCWCSSCQSEALRLKSSLAFLKCLNSITTDSRGQHHKDVGHVCERWGGQTTKEAHVKLQSSLFLQPAGVRNNIVEDRSGWPKKSSSSFLKWMPVYYAWVIPVPHGAKYLKSSWERRLCFKCRWQAEHSKDKILVHKFRNKIKCSASTIYIFI